MHPAGLGSALYRSHRPRQKGRAYDKTTGRLLWETRLPFSANATPITYEIRGWQYVVVAGGGQRDPSTPGGGGVYLAFALK